MRPRPFRTAPRPSTSPLPRPFPASAPPLPWPNRGGCFPRVPSHFLDTPILVTATPLYGPTLFFLTRPPSGPRPFVLTPLLGPAPSPPSPRPSPSPNGGRAFTTPRPSSRSRARKTPRWGSACAVSAPARPGAGPPARAAAAAAAEGPGGPGGHRAGRGLQRRFGGGPVRGQRGVKAGEGLDGWGEAWGGSWCGSGCALKRRDPGVWGEAGRRPRS